MNATGSEIFVCSYCHGHVFEQLKQCRHLRQYPVPAGTLWRCGDHIVLTQRFTGYPADCKDPATAFFRVPGFLPPLKLRPPH